MKIKSKLEILRHREKRPLLKDKGRIDNNSDKC